MARRRNRYHPIELRSITIGLMYLACGMNGLLGALTMYVQGQEIYELLVGGFVALAMALVWIFENPFVTSRPFTSIQDLATVTVMTVVVNGLILYRFWPMIILMVLEGFLIVRFYLYNRRRKRH